MRMWMVDPGRMCSQHLLGEHVEIHMLAGMLRRNKSVDGFIRRGLLEVHSARRRHDRLAAEMKRRGFKHQSPLPKVRWQRMGRVDRNASAIELARRCDECARLQAQCS